jgi:hypothetical protein
MVREVANPGIVRLPFVCLCAIVLGMFFSLLQLGIAFLVNGLWLPVTLIPAVALMSFVVIPRKEALPGDPLAVGLKGLLKQPTSIRTGSPS